MIVNKNTVIIGRNVVLVPYRPEHVPTYHKWMLSAELRELTASDPLTLDEEYQMQRASYINCDSGRPFIVSHPHTCTVKWQTDADKLTFIILARPHVVLSSGAKCVHRDEWDSASSPLGLKTIAQLPMVGDVNLFFKGTPGDGVEEVEVEVMIADDAYRRKGVACDALQVLLHYASSPDGPQPLRVSADKFVVRIGQSNDASQRLFEKLGFAITKRVPVFHEVEMRYHGSGLWTGGRIITLE